MLSALRANGLKVTPQRLAILRELAGDLTHPTAMDLFERLRPGMPTMSFATVYNTLAALTEQGLCVARALEVGPVRFDPNMTPHDHAVCDRCGLVVDLPLPEAHAASALPGFAVRVVERIYRGSCAACASREGHAGGGLQATGE
ncbi:MAG: transcriptional repressor [Deltaproteobacteria bacterium]|nr:transcriptional repressor [Deltaproteobacteria bacterium]